MISSIVSVATMAVAGAARLHPGFTGPPPCLHSPVLYWVVTEPLSSEEVEA
jgi:hypothetical protein